MHKDWMHIDTSTRQYATDKVHFIKSCGEFFMAHNLIILCWFGQVGQVSFCFFCGQNQEMARKS